jgi:hypothetical protein
MSDLGGVKHREEVWCIGQVDRYGGVVRVCGDDHVWAIKAGHELGGSSGVCRFVLLLAVLCQDEDPVCHLVGEVHVVSFVGLVCLVNFHC